MTEILTTESQIDTELAAGIGVEKRMIST